MEHGLKSMAVNWYIYINIHIYKYVLHRSLEISEWDQIIFLNNYQLNSVKVASRIKLLSSSNINKIQDHKEWRSIRPLLSTCASQKRNK